MLAGTSLERLYHWDPGLQRVFALEDGSVDEFETYPAEYWSTYRAALERPQVGLYVYFCGSIPRSPRRRRKLSFLPPLYWKLLQQ